ncbi:uncharacterized protein LOC120568507, partial [Perca fluviatilis]|uniref:uncharacterized protein LOC120568507 n=1 Tax=Perca fluviatilis TaxID=8168 RepID=UPI001964B884
MLSLQHCMFSLLFLSILTGVSCEELTSVVKEENSLEGSSVTLSYRYSKQATGADEFYWYRQHPGKHPEFIISHLGTGTTMKNPIPSTDSAVERLFSFSFYCSGRTLLICCLFGFNNSKDMLLYLFLLFSPFIALSSMNSIKPESTEEHVAEGTNINLTCTYESTIYNIQWYRQYQRSRPEFLLYITEGGSIHRTGSDFQAHIDKTKKHVKLEIISAKVSDSAVYYCALT